MRNNPESEKKKIDDVLTAFDELIKKTDEYYTITEEVKADEKISDIMNCLKNKGVRYFKHDFKTRLHSFFSLTDGFVGSKVGEAARYGAFNWESIELEYLYKMIIEAFG